MKSLAQPLAALLERLHGEPSPAIAEATHALCDALAAGHICLPLRQLGPGVESALRGSKVVGCAETSAPLSIENGYLYFARYRQYEAKLAAHLLARARADDAAPAEGLLRQAVEMTGDPAQQTAVASALRRRLCVITGGPGTGKTRTATIALSLLAEHLRSTHPRFALAAPTGKAAARLTESLATTQRQFDFSPGAGARMNPQAVTLHRLLGAVPGEAQFRFHAGRPLPVDVLVVDEASMVDLPLMAKLLDALRPEARLILLGDRDQLASVEAGHVLGDVCGGGAEIRRCVTELTTNHRFTAVSGIHQLAAAVRSGDLGGALSLLRGSAGDLIAHPIPRRLHEALAAPLISGWKPVAEARTPAEALARMGDFRVLCSVRDGPQGVLSVNRAAEQALATARIIQPNAAHYAHKPILILRNDYALKLANGDLGILRKDEAGLLRAYFPGDDGTPRSFAPARLPEHEAAYAMTVHKAQGSEFGSILFIMPEADSPVLTRELVYTAITRARNRAEIWWSEETFSACIARRVIRWSGLRERLQD